MGWVELGPCGRDICDGPILAIPEADVRSLAVAEKQFHKAALAASWCGFDGLPTYSTHLGTPNGSADA